MKSLHRLSIQYDAERLLADLATAERLGQYHDHYNAYAGEAEGGWSSIPLVSRGGGLAPESSLDFGRYMRQTRNGIHGGPPPFQKTEILKKCPYFEGILDDLQCQKRRVRLLRLAPGARIYRHRDPGESWAGGRPRLHLAIVTHDEVYFHLDGQRVIMRPGEAWYCDFTRPHSVENRSPIARVHLMCELVVNDWLRQQFPPESLAERASNRLYRTGIEARWRAARYGHGIGQMLNDLRTKLPTASRDS